MLREKVFINSSKYPNLSYIPGLFYVDLIFRLKYITVTDTICSYTHIKNACKTLGNVNG